MNYHFIEKKDPHVEVLFQGLENLERMLSDMEKAPKPKCSTRNPTYRNFWRMPIRGAGKNRGGCEMRKWRNSM